MEAESLVKPVFLIAFIRTKTERDLLSTEKQHAALCFFLKLQQLELTRFSNQG